MGKARKLTAADLEGAEFIDAAPAAPRRLTAADLEGAEFVDAPPPVREKSESFLRGVLQGATFGHADEIAAAIEAPFSSETYEQIRDRKRGQYKAAEAANPKTYLAGDLAGGFVIPGVGVAKGGLRGAQTVSQLAARGAAAGALSGLGHSEKEGTDALEDAATGALVGGAISGTIGKIVRKAPERLLGRSLKDIAEGEAGAKLSTVKKITERAGEEGKDFADLLSRSPELRRAIGIKASGEPGKVAAVVEQKMSKIGEKLTPIYEKIDEATGGVRLLDLNMNLDKLRRKLSSEGHGGMAEVVERTRQRIVNQFGDDGKISEYAKLPARSVRNLANEIGELAFAGDPTVPAKFRARAQQALYREVVGSIEKAAEKTKGVSVQELRQLNKDMSLLIPIKTALTERASKEASGRTTLMSRVLSANMIGGGFAAGGGLMLGGIPGAIGGYAAKEIGTRVGKPAIRAVDYALARLVEEARKGSTPAKLGQMAVELGLARQTGEAVAAWARRNATAPTEPQAEP